MMCACLCWAKGHASLARSTSRSSACPTNKLTRIMRIYHHDSTGNEKGTDNNNKEDGAAIMALRAGTRRLLAARAQQPATTAAVVGKRGLASAEPAAAKSSRAEELMQLEVRVCFEVWGWLVHWVIGVGSFDGWLTEDLGLEIQSFIHSFSYVPMPSPKSTTGPVRRAQLPPAARGAEQGPGCARVGRRRQSLSRLFVRLLGRQPGGCARACAAAS